MIKVETIANNASDYVFQFAATQPSSIAVIFNNKKYSYKELKENISSCAKGLIGLGLRKGDKVAMLCNASYEYYELLLASISIGVVWVGLNPKYSYTEISYILTDLKPKLLVGLLSDNGYRSETELAKFKESCPSIENVITKDGKEKSTLSYDSLKQDNIVSDLELTLIRQSIDKFTPAIIVYTSGSTGKPKGAVLSHNSLSFGASIQIEHFRIERPKIICNFPINHVACIADICFTTLLKGGTIIFHESFEPELMLQTIVDENVNILGVVPTMLQMILSHPTYKTFDLSSLELVIWGGAAILESTLREITSFSSARLMTAYGMTETAAHTVYTTQNAHFDELLNTIGKPEPKMPCRIVDKGLRKCAVGEVGELQFTGDYLFLEYFGQPKATKEAFTADGWFKTGDLGMWNNNGTISLVGRSSDMFKSGGYNVYPREVELYLDGLDDVEASTIVGVPNEKFQEVGVAFIITKSKNLTVNYLIKQCKLGLANYKIPKKFILNEKVPTLPNGKVDKLGLKKMAMQLLVEVN